MPKKAKKAKPKPTQKTKVHAQKWQRDKVTNRLILC